MKIGIIGAGHIGATLARHFAKAGHEVGISNSRGPHTLAGLVKSMGPKTCAMTSHEAAWFGDIVILAAPWRKTEALPLPKLVAGKIVVDAMNPYSAEGEVISLGETTSSEEVARHLPGARLVKAFNTMYYHTLATETRDSANNRLVIFLAGDDADAKQTVARLIEQIGFAPLDTGSLRTGGRMQEPDSPLYNRPLTPDEACAALRSLKAAVAHQ
jgi:8-hydroxy-5-deazaflavin:NADPH oxidoreductase